MRSLVSLRTVTSTASECPEEPWCSRFLSRKTGVRAVGSRRFPAALREERGHGGSFHAFFKRLLEGFHFGLGAYRYSHVRRPYRPYSSDVDFLRFHGLNELLTWALHIDHETVGFGGNEGILVCCEPRKNVVPNVPIDFLSLGNQVSALQAGLGGYDRSDRHGVPAIRIEFGQQVRAGNRESAA